LLHAIGRSSFPAGRPKATKKVKGNIWEKWLVFSGLILIRASDCRMQRKKIRTAPADRTTLRQSSAARNSKQQDLTKPRLA
jgi:hypothetical protein